MRSLARIFVAKSLGLDKDSLASHRENGYSSSSKPTEQQIEDTQAEDSLKAEKKAKADEARKAKQAEKVFEKDAVLSALVPGLE